MGAWGKKWDRRISIGDLHNSFRNGVITVTELGAKVAARLHALKIDDDALADIIEQFDDVEDVEEYDYVLGELYDWADIDKRLWIEGDI